MTTKLKNSSCGKTPKPKLDKTKKSNCDKTKKNVIVTKLKKPNSDITQKLKL